MDKKRCKTCKYWEKAQEVSWAWGPAPRWVGYCTRAASRSGVAQDEKTMMVAADYEDHMAWLETLPNFGCTMWEKRKGNNNEG